MLKKYRGDRAYVCILWIEFSPCPKRQQHEPNKKRNRMLHYVAQRGLKHLEKTV